MNSVSALLLGTITEMPRLKDSEWKSIFDFCLKQSVVGIGFGSNERLPKEQQPPKHLLLQWYALTLQIENRNRLLNERCVKLQEMFAEAGFATCILKGQGNALMYPNPLRRQSGDIDIWILPKLRIDNGKLKIKSVVDFLASKVDIKKQFIGYHHVEFPIFEDVEVEVHWRPSWRSSPLYNYRLQRWFRNHIGCTENKGLPDKEGNIIVPSWEFNVIYQLQHMFLHIFQEGLGLRQVMDYYFLLKSEVRNLKSDQSSTLKYLGLWQFAGAMMYVMREVFLLDEQYMIAPVDKKRGKFLLDEILQSGNFGQVDARNKELRQKRGMSRSIARFKRQYRFLRDYPHETLCAPFQVYHVIWRKLKLWKWE